MKKIYLLSTLLIIGTFFVVNQETDAAENILFDTEQSTDAINYQHFEFKSYPPKKYKGLTLILVSKTKNGYIGTYL